MTLTILRRDGPDAPPRWESYAYEPAEAGETVAAALRRLNEYPDPEKRPAVPIRWDCGCLQKRCGACAMVINGRPALACDARLSSFRGRVTLEPLRKFPAVADLIVDRGAMFGNLNALRLWLNGAAAPDAAAEEDAYEASRCLQCGCCLEICPNFAVGGPFAGMAAAVPVSRLLAEAPSDGALRRAYRARVYEGCGKSLACRDVCPAGIEIDRLLARSNAAAVWRKISVQTPKGRLN